MIRLNELFNKRFEFFATLEIWAKSIIAYPNPAKVGSSEVEERTLPLEIQLFNKMRTKGNEDLVLIREAQAIVALHEHLNNLRSFARLLDSTENQTRLQTMAGKVLDEGTPFEERLTTLKNDLKEDWFKNLSFQGASFDQPNQSIFTGLVRNLKVELSWLVGDEIERDFLIKYSIPKFGVFKEKPPEEYKYWETMDENGVFKEFHASIVDQIIFLARNSNLGDEAERGRKAQILHSLNAALLDLDIYTREHDSAPHRKLLNLILESARAEGVDFATRLKKLKSDLTAPNVENLVLEDQKFARIVKEIFAAIGMLGVGYLIAKGVDMLKYDNSWNECVFFKDPTHKRLKEVEKQVDKLSLKALSDVHEPKRLLGVPVVKDQQQKKEVGKGPAPSFVAEVVQVSEYDKKNLNAYQPPSSNLIHNNGDEQKSRCSMQ